MTTREITVYIKHYGKEKKYGERVYKVGKSDGPYLEAIGWKTIHRTFDYAYMQAPELLKRRLIPITLTVPTREAIEALANKLWLAGERYTGVLAGWPVRFTPEREGISQQRGYNTETGWRTEERPYYHPAEFEIGTWSDPWHVSITYEFESSETPRYSEHIEGVS